MKKVEMPYINVRDIVFYPGMEQSLFIGREFTIKAIQHALKFNNGRIAVVTQKALEKGHPNGIADMFSVGTVCRIKQSVLMTDGAMKALLHAEGRVRVAQVVEEDGIRKISGRILQARKSSVKIPAQEKRALLELLVRWNPSLAIDDEDGRWSALKGENKQAKFLEGILGLMCTRKTAGFNANSMNTKPKASPTELRALNAAVKSRQLVLEEGSPAKQRQMVKAILSAEL